MEWKDMSEGGPFGGNDRPSQRCERISYMDPGMGHMAMGDAHTKGNMIHIYILTIFGLAN
jgi:hypothetical protein